MIVHSFHTNSHLRVSPLVYFHSMSGKLLLQWPLTPGRQSFHKDLSHLHHHWHFNKIVLCKHTKMYGGHSSDWTVTPAFHLFLPPCFICSLMTWDVETAVARVAWLDFFFSLSCMWHQLHKFQCVSKWLLWKSGTLAGKRSLTQMKYKMLMNHWHCMFSSCTPKWACLCVYELVCELSLLVSFFHVCFVPS